MTNTLPRVAKRPSPKLTDQRAVDLLNGYFSAVTSDPTTVAPAEVASIFDTAFTTSPALIEIDRECEMLIKKANRKAKIKQMQP